MLWEVGEETKPVVVEEYTVEYRQMVIFMVSDLVDLLCLCVRRVSFGEIGEGFR